jgi:DNA-binding CsgD family transcriptional regulator
VRARGLTPTERHVARLAARGLQNQQIAGELGISAETVEAHLDRIFRRLGLAGDPLSVRVDRGRH